jgi:hypothetical protein
MFDQSKLCTDCKVIKPFSEFHANKVSKDGKVNKCKACSAIYISKYNEIKGIQRKKKPTLDLPPDHKLRRMYNESIMSVYLEEVSRFIPSYGTFYLSEEE